MKQFLRNLATHIPLLDNALVVLSTQLEALSGHYYSPIPSNRDIARRSEFPKKAPVGIDLGHDRQAALIREFAAFYPEVPFDAPGKTALRYSSDNSWFGRPDAIFLYCFLRKLQPGKIIEIGSGYSSAVMLDTSDLFLQRKPHITFIEPFPKRLRKLLRPSDEASTELIEAPVQNVPIEKFAALQRGDLLFIDSSHVLKRGSDVQFLLFEVLPALSPGVYVHFHDVNYPFEYPDTLLRNGRYWNEAYALRTFLAFNCEWQIRLFADYATFALKDFLREMPSCFGGCSLYIQRVGDLPGQFWPRT